MQAARSHDDAMLELLREDPVFDDGCLAAALEGIEEPGGKQASLRALRHVTVPKECNKWRNALTCLANGFLVPFPPETLLAVLSAAGLRLAVARRNERPA
jgi:DNA-binding phage protein